MINIPLPMQPVRGQMLLFKLETDKHPGIATGPIVNEGSRYLVPRTDGHVLTGSTIEEVGFDTSTTIEGIEDILSWASSISPQLNRSTLKKTWAGLRPATFDGFPYLGRMGELKNAFVATGHFKGGLHISTATAIVISDLLDGNKPTIDVDALSPNRAADHKFD
jgi:glycine oxidase